MATEGEFPARKEDFDNDYRISFSKEKDKYILEEEDGTEWEFMEDVAGTGKWIREGEIVEVETGFEQFAKKKRKMLEEAKDQPSKKPKAERLNTAIYITSLPLDVTVDEIHEAFSKYGIIAEEVESNKPRIKIYTDDNGNPKGDALVVYFRPESVKLAIQMMDDSDLRWGEKGPDGPMRVKEADASYKKTQPTDETKDVKRGRPADKKKIIAKTERLKQRLANWSDDEDELMPAKESRWDKFVVLKHMFTIEGLTEELKTYPDAKEDLLEDVKEQCAQSGEILGMYLYDLEPEGVITVRFAEAAAARDCIARLHGRGFDGRKVEASIATGNERFKKSKKQAKESDSEEDKRLNSFGDAIEEA